MFGTNPFCGVMKAKSDWKWTEKFFPSKAYYDLGSYTTLMPATLEGLYRTKILDSQNKWRFAYEVFKTMASIEKGEEGIPIGQYLEKEPPKVRDLLLTIASSNFFTNEPEKFLPRCFSNITNAYSPHNVPSVTSGRLAGDCGILLQNH